MIVSIAYLTGTKKNFFSLSEQTWISLAHVFSSYFRQFLFAFLSRLRFR